MARSGIASELISMVSRVDIQVVEETDMKDKDWAKRLQMHLKNLNHTRQRITRSVGSATPPGLVLRHTLRSDAAPITRLAWSPDGRILGSLSTDQVIRLWDPESESIHRELANPEYAPLGFGWSSDSQTLHALCKEARIVAWNVDKGEIEAILYLTTRANDTDGATIVEYYPTGNANLVSEMKQVSDEAESGSRYLFKVEGTPLSAMLKNTAFFGIGISPDGRFSAATSKLGIQLWDLTAEMLAGAREERPQSHASRDFLSSILIHLDYTRSAPDDNLHVAWQQVAESKPECPYYSDLLAPRDNAVRIYDTKLKRQVASLEGHTASITAISFSSDNRLLASKSEDGTVRLWRCDSWEPVAILDEPTGPDSGASGLAFHPQRSALASLGNDDTAIRIWDLDLNILLASASALPSVHYTNAKVVLVGDTGVGKSGLALVLAGQSFAPTDSTHGRRVWVLPHSEERGADGLRKGTRETILWDLAGQPGYRLIHQLHLNETAVALVVFDARSETDPFSGVYHWNRALRQAMRLQVNCVIPMKKYLVAARADRGNVAASRQRIDALVHDLGFDGYFETSAKEGWNIEELASAIQTSIDWSTLPKVSSTDLFQQIKEFLIGEKEKGHLLSTVEDLYFAFLKLAEAPSDSAELRTQFKTCISLVESRGLIQQLSFGNLVLLQPELLDAYASAIVNAAREELDGMGYIAEEDVRAGRFRMSSDERIEDKQQEKLLLIATIEDLLRHEIALREQAEGGAYLVFPSQFTRENPDLPDPEGKSVIFRFEGSVMSIYTTLAVRLSHSDVFKKKEMRKNAAAYSAMV